MISVYLLTSTLGCAAGYSLSLPGPIHDENVTVGMHRQEVDALLSTKGGTVSNPAEEVTVVHYRFVDGPHQATKLRALVYLAGDVFTLFLSEIIFWPIEIAVKNGAQSGAEAHYDNQNRLTAFRSYKSRSNREKVSVGNFYPTPPSVKEEDKVEQ